MTPIARQPGNLRRFLRYARPYRRRIAVSTAVGILKYNLPVLFPWLLKDVVDNLLAGRPSRLGLGLDQLMGLAVLLFVLFAVITYLRTHIADRLSTHIILDVRRDLFAHLERLPVDFFHEHQTGMISSRLFTDVALARNFISLAMTNLFMDLSTLLSIMAVIFLMDWRLALVACATLPAFYLLQRHLGIVLRRRAKEARARMELIEGDLHEVIAGIGEVKSFTLEDEQSRRFEDRCRHFLEAAFASIRTQAWGLSATALLTRVPPVLVVWAGGHLVLRGELTVGALMAFFAYMEMIYNPLNRLSDLNIQLANARAAIDRLFEFFDEKPEGLAQPAAPPVRVSGGEVRFEDVEFGYRPGLPVLRGASLRIPAGQRVALVGESGAGKSTLTRLLIRFHDPWAGRVLVDGQDVREVDLASLRRQVAMVHQDPMLFSGSVADNIRVGRPGASAEEIRAAARLANADRFISALPHGYETTIGERGVKLSGGQRQRIALARAFLKDAPILVLDESTSNLDGPSEQLVFEAMERLAAGRTTIVIAHRMSTVVRADRIVVFAAGRVAQEGTHAELLARADGPYRELYLSGAVGEVPEAGAA